MYHIFSKFHAFKGKGLILVRSLPCASFFFNVKWSQVHYFIALVFEFFVFGPREKSYATCLGLATVKCHVCIGRNFRGSTVFTNKQNLMIPLLLNLSLMSMRS